MLDNKFFLLLVNFLWMIGLFGTLFTIAYTIQYRRKRWWNVGHSNSVPRTQVPLYLALATFCVGLALHAFLTGHAISTVVTFVWGFLATLFLVRFIQVINHGIQLGWDTPLVDETPAFPGWQRLVSWRSFVLLLLLSNLALLGWWGNLRLTANSTEQQFAQSLADGGTRTLQPFSQSPQSTAADAAGSDLLTPRLNTKVSATVTTTVTATVTIAADSGILQNGVANQVGSAAGAVATIAPEALLATPTPEPTRNDNLPQIIVATSTSVPVIGSLPVTATTPLTPEQTAPDADSLASTLTASVNSLYGANLRAAPTTASDVRTLIPDQTTLAVLGQNIARDWLLVQLVDGTEGWIAKQLLVGPGVEASVPIVE